MPRTSPRKRPCRICGKWFRPDPREGTRQRACRRPPCQRERHRRACAAWHRVNPGYDREARLRRRLTLFPPPSPKPVDPLGASPMGRLNLEAARDAVGLEVTVVLEVAGQVIWEGVRDAVRTQLVGTKDVSRRLPPGPTRDDMAKAPRAP
jgi:hypothetical protein